MTRPASVVRILCVLALLVAAGCRSGGGPPAAPGSDAAGAGRRAPAPGGDATAYGNGWVWTAPGPAWVGLPAADDTQVAFTYGHQHLVLLDAEGRLQWDTYRLGLRDVAPRLAAELVLAATDDGVAAFRRSDGAKVWDTTLAERANSLVPVGSRAVTTTWEGSMVAFDLADGKVAWRVALPGPSLGPPATDGTVVVATWDRSDRRSGGAVAVDAARRAPAVGGRAAWRRDQRPGGLEERGTVVVVAGDLAAHALALTTGSERWRTEVDGAGSPEVPRAGGGRPVGPGRPSPRRPRSARSGHRPAHVEGGDRRSGHARRPDRRSAGHLRLDPRRRPDPAGRAGAGDGVPPPARRPGQRRRHWARRLSGLDPARSAGQHPRSRSGLVRPAVGPVRRLSREGWRPSIRSRFELVHRAGAGQVGEGVPQVEGGLALGLVRQDGAEEGTARGRLEGDGG